MRTPNYQHIGIMQSRLSPLSGTKYQQFPASWWELEFKLAQQYGFSHIEWIYDDNPDNILNQEDGYKQVLKQILNTGVEVEAICADYFIEHPFWDNSQFSVNIKKLHKLIIDGFRLGSKVIVIPLLENSTIDSKTKIRHLVKNLSICLEYASRYMINICLETDLPPEHFHTLLRYFDGQERIGVCYDSGNSAASGYVIDREFSSFGHLIKHVHIKDRTLSGPNTQIGKGATEFTKLFDFLQRFDYTGKMTLQCARTPEYNLDYINQQFETTKQYIEKAYIK